MCGGGGGSSSNQIQETADQKEQMRINAELWNYYQTEYKPLIDKYAARVTDPETRELESKKVAGRINASVMKNITPEGVSANPVVNTKKLMKLADLETGALQEGEARVKGKQISETQNIIDIGRGAATTATEGLDVLASKSPSDEELKQREGAVFENAVGSLAGMAAAGYFRGGPKKLTVRKPYDYPLNDLPM